MLEGAPDSLAELDRNAREQLEEDVAACGRKVEGAELCVEELASKLWLLEGAAVGTELEVDVEWLLVVDGATEPCVEDFAAIFWLVGVSDDSSELEVDAE